MWHDILIVHGQRVLRQGLHQLLSARPDLRVVGEASEGHEAVALASSLKPSIVILESMLSGLNSQDVTRRIADAVSGVRIIVLARAESSAAVNQVINAGALGFLTPDAGAAELSTAIDTVLAGGVYVDPRIETLMQAPASPAESLTQRQRQVLRLMAEGRSTREIAAALDLSVKTVETHRKHVMDRLGLRTVAELTKFAIREGLTTL